MTRLLHLATAMRRSTSRPLLASLTLALGVLSGAARADQCLLRTTPLSFGSYEISNPGAVESSASVSFSCTGTGSISVDVAASITGSVSSRAMTASGSSDRLAYNVYLDAARTLPLAGWTFEVLAAEVTTMFYGRIAAGQDVAPGSYHETIVMTVLP